MMQRSNPSSFSSDEFLETSESDVEADIEDAWLDENFRAIRDNRDIPRAWVELEAHFLDMPDDGANIPESWLEQTFTAPMDVGDILEAEVVQHFIFGSNGVDVPLLASFVDHQVVLVPTQRPDEDYSTRKVGILEWIFLIINVLIELLSAAFDQLSSASNPKYALIAMLMSSVATIICIIELAYKAGKERVIWRWQSKLPWFYYSSPSHRRFGTFPEIIGLVCAMLQTVLSAVAYTFYLEHANYPLKVSVWPVVFALGLFCSKFM